MAAAMAFHGALAAVLLCAAFLAAHAATPGEHQHNNNGGDMVTKACANLTSGSVTKEFCESALRSDSSSAAAKRPRDLALVAVDLVGRGAAAAGARVDAALRSAGGGAAAAASNNVTVLGLRYCRADYDAVARTAPVCRRLVSDYTPGRRDGDLLLPYTYLECADRLKAAAGDCWGYVHWNPKGGVEKLVGKEVDELLNRAILLKAMLEQMLGIVEDF